MHKAAILTLLVMGGLVYQPAFAAPEERHEQHQDQRDERHNRRFGPNEAAKRAQVRNNGGTVLSVKPVDQGYNVKLLKQGEVRVLTVPDNP